MGERIDRETIDKIINVDQKTHSLLMLRAKDACSGEDALALRTALLGQGVSPHIVDDILPDIGGTSLANIDETDKKIAASDLGGKHSVSSEALGGIVITASLMTEDRALATGL